MTPAEVYALARSVGLTHADALTGTAVAWAESGLRPRAVNGSAAGGEWGPAVGLWQVRSLRAQKGTGGDRDADRLKAPAFNARSMAGISGGGRNWSPWEAFTNGRYRDHLAAVSKAVGDGSDVPAAPSVGSSPTEAAAYATPAAGISLNPFNPGAMWPVLLTGGAVVLGLVLVGVGLYRVAA